MAPLQPTTSVDASDLERKVQTMYRAVAENPRGHYHFELGRGLAERLGYSPEILDRIAAEAVESFAGVGFFFDMIVLAAGDHVLDLGSGSGMDAFYASLAMESEGHVVGIDMTPEQLAKARRLASEAALGDVRFVAGRVEDLPFEDDSFDMVMSNGVINLVADKGRVFEEAARVLRPGGRLAIADIVSERRLPPNITTNSDLWASCIGGAAQQDDYQDAVEAAGLRIELMRMNRYTFLSAQAANASDRFGVKSICLVARKRETARRSPEGQS